MAVTACTVCDAPLSGRRTNARVCSPACRRELSRIRRLAAGESERGYATLGQYLGRRQKRAKAGVR
jgi:hypothetical protein